jgi:alpha-glucosidase
MASDFIENYDRYPDAFEFIKNVPVSWDTTIVLNGEVEEYLTIARKDRENNDWYIGGITNEERRTLKFELSFLDEGLYNAKIYADGKSTDWLSNPLDYEIFNGTVSKNNLMTMELASGGGQVIHLKKMEN